MAVQRRRVSKLSSAQAKAIVADLVACRLEGLESKELSEGFKARMMRLYKRLPTEGELALYQKEFGKLVSSLLKRGEKARSEGETGYEEPPKKGRKKKG